MDLFLIEMNTYKVFFEDIETSENAAKELILRHDPSAEIHNFYSKREVGCNILTFAVITSSLEKMRTIEQDGTVKRIEIISSARHAKNEDCGSGSCCKVTHRG